MTTHLNQPREVERLVNGMPTSDGAGVKLLRVLTQDLQRRLDPFLMLDYFHSDDPGDYLAGFPDHPHRGFETVTYMLAGRMRHRDNAGNEGLLGPGGVQWMTAGRGIVHSELPEQEDGLMQGFQLWLNLPGRNKMTTPAYRDIPADEIPVVTREDGVTVKVIAGEALGVAGAVSRPDTEPLYLDVQLPAGTRFEQPLPAGFNAFVYVYEGQAQVGGRAQPVAARQMAVLETREERDGVRVAAGDAPVRLLLIAGKPLRESIAQWGPFVMNSREEVIQAVEDFNAGKF
ncbi:pirin family protein [Chitinimonas koreensis]|uniref:pirin family protein n=1 Tax=Chitinimonas koreensis TaxID=356302 RepID=UPI00040F18CF|nr:pirin family protein [Chitinimonas koreensis]QNM98221.1 pirin family protein [Chitinimonas koreensis]